jgi:hypothetical protein
MVDFCWMLQRDVPKKKHTADNKLKEVSSQSVKDAILIRNKKMYIVRFLTKNYYKHLIFLNKLFNFFLLIVKKPYVIQKN